MYQLYYSPGSASLVVHWLLLELQLPFTLHKLDFSKNEQKSAAYLAINPSGQVPVLFDGSRYLCESAAIVLYLTEQHPKAGLVPEQGSAQRAEFIQWLMFLTNQLAPTFRLWFYPPDLGMTDYPPATKLALQHKIESCWDRLEQHLTQRGPWLTGDKPTAADFLLTMYMRWSRNMPNTALAWPRLKWIADQLRQRPSWQQLNQTEGLTEWQY
ncbi:glutathione S-transferase family protein [Rheinheimera riviphila]|uniref:Glutathione S-transferase family protein n=1 Tax=Rheinheimera riviphila TaxID=1834037 RepID=A0A437R2V6_9GAMM|nr:glutathione S-transferase family protein [Rheinheimera riviphila]RVU41114.1 glutathione S-transferase family protein [Rheinheimera riviphila]